ncbi:MAG: ATP-binding protein, partial [Nitrospirota bacterium]|nr:ATP-binding protein [Nitrospirota bacterium]
TGLGLSIAKELVERHGGRISVVSESGQGCCFFFSLPVCSGRAIDMAALENAIRPYKKGSMFSLVLLVFDPEIFSHRDGSPSDSYDHILDLVLKALQRDSDLFIAQPSFARIACLLPGTSSLNAVTVRERLTQYFSLSPLSIQDIKIPIPMIMNPVSYPQDGETGKELIEKALSTVVQH